jgi:hypothetical protein
MNVLDKKMQVNGDGNLTVDLGDEYKGQWVNIHIELEFDAEKRVGKLSEFAEKWKGVLKKSTPSSDEKLNYLLKKHGK